jgi:hypothetical protein
MFVPNLSWQMIVFMVHKWLKKDDAVFFAPNGTMIASSQRDVHHQPAPRGDRGVV